MKTVRVITLLAAGCLAGFAIWTGGCERFASSRTLDGQVFVSTQGGDNVRLALVEVRLFDKSAIAEHLEKKRKAAEPVLAAFQPLLGEVETRYEAARKRYEEDSAILPGDADWMRARASGIDAWGDAMAEYFSIKERANYPRSSLYYLSELPTARQTSKTDADGKFNFKIPTGSYVLVATSSRATGADMIGNKPAPSVEYYRWMVKVLVAADTKVMLANDNLDSSGSADSLIRSSGNKGISVAREMEGRNIATLMAFADDQKRKFAEEEAKEKQRKAEAEAKEAERQAEAARRHKEQEEAGAAKKAEAERQAELGRYRKDPTTAQLKAIELYPDLGVKNSPLNTEFVTRLQLYQVEKRQYFQEPDWPIRLAKECSEDLGMQRGLAS